MTDLSNRSKTDFLIQNRIPFIVSILLFSATIISSLLAPQILSPLFDGPDGVRWVAPFLLLMGIFATIYCLFPLFFKKISFNTELFWVGAIIVFFAGILIFVSIQRFSSGLRYIETYNEIMGIRLSQCRSIYPDPEQGPVGTVYTPFFFILCSLFHRFLPAGFAYGRLISLASVLLTALFVYRIVRLRGGAVIAGAFASVVFFSTYSPLDKLYDQSCVDTLLMFLTCVTLFFFLKKTPRGDMAALFFAGLACFTKQSAIYPFLVVLIFILLSRRKLWVYNPLIFWAVIAGVLILITKGWAYTYLVLYPARHGFRELPPSFLIHRFFVLQILLWIGVIYGVIKQRENRFFIYSLAVLAAALFGIFKSGGGIHPLFPVEPLLCIIATDLLNRYKILLICQLILGIYNPFTALYPFTTIRDVDKEIVTLANNAQGDIWLPTETYLYIRTGKKEWDNFCALFGPVWAGKSTPQRLLNALEQKKFDLILMRKNSTDLFRYFQPTVRELVKQGYKSEIREGLVIYKRAE